jgi:hypothetical protein
MRQLFGAVGICMVVACSSSADRSLSAAAPNLQTSSPDAFAGSWRSVTPSLEFIRLTLVSKSSQQGVMGARLTFSGVAWEGNGRIEGDSLRVDMAVVSAPSATGVMVIRASDAQTLRLQVRPASASAFDLTFVREE